MQHISDGLRRTLIDAVKDAPEGDRLEMAWRVVAGTAVADRTRVASLSGGVLKVVVADKAWAGQLDMLARQYVSQLGDLLPGTVKEIRFEVEAR